MLHKSWKEYFVKKNYTNQTQSGCLIGALDFQKRVIEELENEIIPNCTYHEGKVHNSSIIEAIITIKNLKA